MAKGKGKKVKGKGLFVILTKCKTVICMFDATCMLVVIGCYYF